MSDELFEMQVAFEGAKEALEVMREKRDALTEGTLAALAKECHAISCEKGWWNDTKREVMPEGIAAKLCLIHSEVSEALEEVRNDTAHLYYRNGSKKPEGLGPELADIIIRVLDLSARLGIDIGKRVEEKMKYNKTRPHRHGGKKL